MYKAGTITEMLALRDKLPKEVYLYALRLATILDGLYGEDRNIDNDDGGFLLFAENSEDIEEFNRQHMRLEENHHETIELIRCGEGDYLNLLFLCNNEFGINLFLPLRLAPGSLLKEFDTKRRKDE